MENSMKTIILLCAALILMSCSTYAQISEELYQQETTIVTASRYEQLQEDVIPSVTVIGRDDILNLQANSIFDVLSLQQGIDITRNGGIGATTGVFMRGTNSNHVLVLIDGMRVGSSFTGSFAWEHVPISQVERIEIIRGTRVSYYGSDAMGGVINIITRSQENLYARYTGGSFGTHNFDFGFGGSGDLSQYSIVLGSQKTDGYSATNENNVFSYDPDDDGYENQSVNLNYSNNTKNGVLKFNFIQSNADSDFDTGNSDSSERVARISWNNTLFNDWSSEISLGKNDNELETQIFSSNFHSSRKNFDWLLNKQMNNNHIAYGLTYRNEKADFNNPSVPVVSFSDNRNNLAMFGNLQSTHKSNMFSISGRYDNNSVYGNNFSSDVSWAKRLDQKNTINISAGTAFHAPSISELFSPNFQGIVVSPFTGENVFAFSFEGNPDLKPEESINYEAGFKTKFSNTQNFSINLFYYKIDNLIDFQGPTFKPININEATIKGLESAYTYQNNGLVASINATIQDAKNTLTGTPLLRRPDNKINFNVDKILNKFSLGSSIRYASKNPDFGTELDGYTVIDVRTAYRINTQWKIGLKFENVTDKEYQIIDGYNTPKSSGYITLEWQQ